MVVSRMIPVDSVKQLIPDEVWVLSEGFHERLGHVTKEDLVRDLFNAVDIDKNQVISFMARN